MSVMTVRGGFPHPKRISVLHTAVRPLRYKAPCNYLQVKVVTNNCRLYFTEDDATNDENYILVIPASAEEPHGFEGPVEGIEIWLKAETGTSAVELVSYQRRG